MERSGPAFYETDDDDDESSAAELTPAPPTFAERLKELFETEVDDEEDEPGGKKKGLFKRLFSKIPGVVDVEKAEEPPQDDERSFSFSFLSAAEAVAETPDPPEEVDETLVEPHHVEPTVVAPEAPLFDIEEPATDYSLEDRPEADDDPVVPPGFSPPLSPSITPEADVHEALEDVPEPPIITSRPASGDLSYTTPDYEMVATTSPVPETDDYVTRGQAKKYATAAGLAGVGAAVVANSRAKSRERQLENRSEKRDKDLHDKLEAQKHEAQARQIQHDHLRRQLEEERQRTELLRAAQKSQVNSSKPPQVGQAPRPQPLQETYSPDVHDRIPPQVAFEKLTGIEQPVARSLEQERRHEVKDDPSKVPVSYTQIDPHNSGVSHQTATPQSARSNLVNLGSHAKPPTTTPKARNTTQVYKQAIISGAVTAAVVLAAILVIAVLL